MSKKKYWCSILAAIGIAFAAWTFSVCGQNATENKVEKAVENKVGGFHESGGVAGLTATGAQLNAAAADSANYNRNRAYLREFDAKLQAIMYENGDGSSYASILWIGDSYSSSELYTHKIRNFFWRKFGFAGAGWLSANTSYGNIETNATRTKTGAWVDHLYQYPATDTLGIVATNLSYSASSTANNTYAFTATGTDYVIHYIKQSGGGTFAVDIDGGGYSSDIDTANATSAIAFYSTGLTGKTYGSHVITIKVTSTALPVAIAGVEAKRSASGIRWNNLAMSGSAARDWANVTAAQWQAAITQIAPQLVVINLGINDMSRTGYTSTQFQADLQTIIDNVTTALTSGGLLRTSILIVSENDDGATQIFSSAAMAAACKAVAFANSCGYLDNYSVIGDYASDNARGLFANTVHINTAGGELYYLNFKRYILSSEVLNTFGEMESLKQSTSYGQGSLGNKTTGNGDAYGYLTLGSLTTGINDVGYGKGSLGDLTSGNYCVGFGTYTGAALTTQVGNTAVGASSQSNATGGAGTSLGFSAGKYMTGAGNIAVGYDAIAGADATGKYNIAIGYQCGEALTSGNHNLILTPLEPLSGNSYLGNKLTTGSENIFLGYNAGYNQTTASNLLIIDNRDRGSAATELTAGLIVGTFAATTADQAVTLNAATVKVPSVPTYANNAAALTAGLAAGALYYNAQGQISVVIATSPAPTVIDSGDVTAGSLTWAMPTRSDTYKGFWLHLDGCTNTETIITFPTAFTSATGNPVKSGDAAATAVCTVTNTTCTVAGSSTTSGWVFVEGY